MYWDSSRLDWLVGKADGKSSAEEIELHQSCEL